MSHSTCFKNTWDCLRYRAPLLTNLIVFGVGTLVLFSTFHTLFGDIQTYKDVVTIVDGVSHTEHVLIAVPWPVQMIMVDLLFFVFLAVSYLTYTWSCDLWSELKSLKETIKECVVCKKSKGERL